MTPARLLLQDALRRARSTLGPGSWGYDHLELASALRRPVLRWRHDRPSASIAAQKKVTVARQASPSIFPYRGVAMSGGDPVDDSLDLPEPAIVTSNRAGERGRVERVVSVRGTGYPAAADRSRPREARCVAATSSHGGSDSGEALRAGLRLCRRNTAAASCLARGPLRYSSSNNLCPGVLEEPIAA